ncbi:MAG: cellulase family glycosylhydrolase [Fibrobacter sp.]|nr:cellulase family glycosylhydrolase [Fibrobacter sp.]
MSINWHKGLLAAALIFGTLTSISAQTPVARHGALTTSDGYLLNKNGNIVQLRGMSFYWSRPDWPGYSYYNKATLDFLVDSWKCNMVRVAYAPGQGWDGVKAVIDAAIAKGIYVIIDWHSHTAQNEEQQSITFFKEQARTYKNTPNVIFEIFNEPITAGGASEDGTLDNALKTWGAIKGYMKNVTQAIRSEGANNLVIIGTPYYAQFVNVAAADQPKDNSGKPFSNVAYAFHFYAASHGAEAYYVKNGNGTGGMEAEYLKAGLGKVPVFVTEWGTTHSNGGRDGMNYIDGTNTNWWFNNYINGKYKLSWANWSVSSHETSSCFSGGTSASQSGQIVQNLLKATNVDEYEPEWKAGLAGPAADSTFTMPNTLPASSFNKYYGSVSAANVSFINRDNADVRNAKNKCINVTSLISETWNSYKINSTSATSKLVLRCLAKEGDGTVEVYVDNTKAGEVKIPKNTSWNSIITNISVSAGQHVLKFRYTYTTGSGYSIEWLELTNNPVNTERAVYQHRINNADPVISVRPAGFKVVFPYSHAFKAYSLIGANGRVVKSGSMNEHCSEMNFDDLPGGMWLLKLDNINGSKLFKTIVNGR